MRCAGTIDIRDSGLVAASAARFIARFSACAATDQRSFSFFFLLSYLPRITDPPRSSGLLSFLRKGGTTSGAGSWPDIVCHTLFLSFCFTRDALHPHYICSIRV